MSAVFRSTTDWEREIGSRVRRLRKQNGMSQQDLADRANISRSAVKYLESGVGSSLATFINVARAFDLDESIDRIFTEISELSPLAIIESHRRNVAP